MEDTAKIASDFLLEIKKRANSNKRATVVGLFGDLGSGKTTFSQALGKKLGILEFMTSPTFVIEKVYKIDSGSHFKNLIHIDAYRLEKRTELEVLGFNDLINDPKNLILIEWPERVIDILPEDLIKINFKFISENEREIII